MNKKMEKDIKILATNDDEYVPPSNVNINTNTIENENDDGKVY